MMHGIFITGPAGCGKSTVGRLLAARLALPFLEGDDFHGADNVAKMAAGTPLTDEDRWPWLDRIAAAAASAPAVVSCSALRRIYRGRLLAALGGKAVFVQLIADPSEIVRRVALRTDHFMPPALVASQLATLEPLDPAEPGLILDAALPPSDLAAVIADWLSAAE